MMIPASKSQTGMRKISWRMTSSYYLDCKHPPHAIAQRTLLEIIDVFSLCVTVQLTVTPINTSPVAPPPPAPRQTRLPSRGIFSLSVVYKFGRQTIRQ